MKQTLKIVTVLTANVLGVERVLIDEPQLCDHAVVREFHTGYNELTGDVDDAVIHTHMVLPLNHPWYDAVNHHHQWDDHQWNQWNSLVQQHGVSKDVTGNCV